MSDLNSKNKKLLGVDATTCIGCGTCPALCPRTFSINENGIAFVVNPSGESKAEIQEAIDACPVEAISWE